MKWRRADVHADVDTSIANVADKCRSPWNSGMHIDPLRKYGLVWRILLQKPRLDSQICALGYVGLPLVFFRTCDLKKR